MEVTCAKYNCTHGDADWEAKLVYTGYPTTYRDALIELNDKLGITKERRQGYLLRVFDSDVCICKKRVQRQYYYLIGNDF